MTLVINKRRALSAFFRFKHWVASLKGVSPLDYSPKKILLAIDNLREFETRAKSCAKEPETVSWIEEHAAKGKVFYDIGANIGAYSLVAAANNYQVLSFEPAYINYYKLNLNVSLNQADKQIATFPIAFSSTTKLSTFKYLDTTAGTSACYFNEADQFISKYKDIVVEKTALIYSLDDFCQHFNVPKPQAIKIDVDGAELDILKGAQKILAESELQDLLVEVDDRLVDKNELIAFLKTFGLLLKSEFARGNAHVTNCIFKKEKL